MTKLVPIICFILLLTACAPITRNSDSDRELPEPGSIESVRYQQQYKLMDGQDLEINNPFGELQVRKGEPGMVEVTLFVQRLENSEIDGRISQAETVEGLSLEIISSGVKPAGRPFRIDAVVRVPEKTSLHLITDDGRIDGRNLINPLVEAFSESGEIALSSTRIMQLTTKYGNIRATILQPGWNGQHRFVSESGRIRLALPLGPQLSLNVSAGKQIHSEFSLNIEEFETHQAASFTSGDGSDAVLIDSKEGEVLLFSSVFDPRVYGPPSISTSQTTN